MQKVFRLIIFFVGAVIFVGPSVVLADISSPYDMDEILWEGEIEIYKTGSSHYAEDKSTEDLEHKLSGSKDFLARVTIKACGHSGNLTVTDVFWDLSNIEKERETTKEKETRCPGEPDPRSPGSSTMKEKNIEETVYKGLDCKSPEEETSVSLVLQDGKYTLLVGSSIYRQIQIHEEITEEINVCEGQTIPKMMRVVTTSLSSPQQTIPDTNSITMMKHPERYMLPVWPIEKRAVQKVKWRRGISPLRSPRTVRDSLPSYGSYRPADGR